ncbi:MAG: Holliday junction branch migration protein RuvA [Candidatus Taylorbacteria bacterium]|nr:Holliday junction branch migration protein RuvA [Candidatus Taylorbacteria bacterium]
MISSLHGTIAHIDSRYLIIEVNDVGYKVFVTANTLHSLKVGAEIMIHTYLAVREDALDLYGFNDLQEKNLFELLISISGIGPKGALNILSAVSSDALINAIRSNSTAHLVKVSGIGRKTAEKIVLELKDKLGGLIGNEKMSVDMSSDMDAIEALKALGYDANEARDSLKKIDKNIADTGQKVKAALKMLN